MEVEKYKVFICSLQSFSALKLELCEVSWLTSSVATLCCFIMVFVNFFLKSWSHCDYNIFPVSFTPTLDIQLWISIHSLHQISPDQMLWRWNISSFSSSSPDRPPPSFGIPKILSLLQPYVRICVESWRSWGWKVLRVFRGGRMNSLNACVFLYFPVWKGPHSPVSSCPHNSCVVLG